MALTLDERDRLYAAIQNARPNFIVGNGKRVAQMAMEECWDLHERLDEQRTAMAAQQVLAEYYAQHPWAHLWKALKRKWRER